jgi:diguanylate cyclase (GGDEF)-like protein
MERFHGKIAAASDRLGSLFAEIEAAILADEAIAMRAYERSLWLAGLAVAVSLVAMAVGIYLIGRIIAGSVDRLVDGANRFAKGERDHRIDVQIPPELHRVANEFNRMIGHIEESESALAELARRDPLTQLLNRRAFEEELGQMLALNRRTGEEGAILTLDIDHFKKINDTYGHTAGDDVLREMAQCMQSHLRPYDNLYRIGGEEFAVLLPGVDAQEALEMAERLRVSIDSRKIKVGEHRIDATVSVGVASTLGSVEPKHLLEAADAALYHAKANGRNQVVAISETGFRVRATEDENVRLLSERLKS